MYTSGKPHTIYFLLFLFGLLTIGEAFLSAQTSYHVINKAILRNSGLDITKMIVLLPVPQSNEYQKVGNLSIPQGELLNMSNTNDKYLRYLETENCLESGKQKEIFYEFDITLYPIRIDFSKITTLYPYDKNSYNYKSNTGKSGNIIDPSNPNIIRIGEELWQQSTDIIDYARRCYDHVGRNYKYLNPGTGLHPLSEIFAKGGGDCGNLSSIFISLLRYKDIPARHIVTMRPNGEYHVWADFYLEKHGWIPVDVTLKNSNPSGDYFGFCAGDGIVFNQACNVDVEPEPGRKETLALLQTYYYWYWYKGGSGRVTCNHTLSSRTIQEEELVEVEGVTLDKNQLSMETGDQYQLTATVKPANATNKLVYWNSDNQQIVQVTPQGKLTALKAGNATITATTVNNGFTANCQITVKSKDIPIEKIILNKELLEMEIGDEFKLEATVVPENATNKEILWKSKNEQIVQVDQQGKLRALQEGTTKVYVSTPDGLINVQCTITVKNPAVSNESLNSVEDENISVKDGCLVVSINNSKITSIYTLSGQLMFKQRLAPGLHSIRLNKGGYIINVGPIKKVIII